MQVHKSAQLADMCERERLWNNAIKIDGCVADRLIELTQIEYG